MSMDPVKYLFKVDPQLGILIRTVGRYSIKIRTSAFQSLVESIIYQQLTGRAASVIYTRFIKYYNNVMPTPMEIISTSDIELKSKVGLSSTISKGSFYKGCRTKARFRPVINNVL